MLNSILTDATGAVTVLSPQALALCTLVSLILGVGVALVYMRGCVYSKSFVVTLALLPAMVQWVITLVNGNLGTGVAVMGAFGLVRFRSLPGSAREIGAIFFAMAIGLATGMGYLAYAALFLLLIGVAMLLLNRTTFGEPRSCERLLRITLPEDVEYEGLFDDLFQQYTRSAELQVVRTANMGSLFELHYRIVLRTPQVPKAFLDALRCRNGNLNIVCGQIASVKEGL